jgi:hypothetical protein
MAANRSVTATFSPGGGAIISPTPAQIRALLFSEIVPAGKAAHIRAIFKAGAFWFRTFRVLEAGTAVVAWYQLPRGARLASRRTKARPVLVATGRLTFAVAGTGQLRVKLTAAGRRLLKHAKHLKLTAGGTFTPTGKPAVATTRAFTLAG